MRSDLLNITRIANFFSPDKIKSLLNEKGHPIFKLESIANTNDIKNFTAHDALGDTYATKELAKIILNKTPEIWDQSTTNLNKEFIENRVIEKPFCYLESFFGKTKLFCLSFIDFHPIYKWALCFDLRENPEETLNMNDIDFKTYIEESPKLIRNLKLNKSPILLDINKKSFSEIKYKYLKSYSFSIYADKINLRSGYYSYERFK